MIHIWQSSWEQSVDGWAAILLAEPTKFEGTVSLSELGCQLYEELCIISHGNLIINIYFNLDWWMMIGSNGTTSSLYEHIFGKT